MNEGRARIRGEASVRFYRLLLRLYPGKFRQRFADEMSVAFGDALQEARPRGVSELIGFWASTVRDVLLFALEEHSRKLRRRGMERAHTGLRQRVRRYSGGSTSPGAGPHRSYNLVDDLRTDLTFALRGLSRNAGFAAVAILSLAVAIGANTAVFSVIDAVLLRPLPYAAPEQLVMVYSAQLREGREPRRMAVAPGMFLQLQERNETFSEIAAVKAYPDAAANVAGGDEPRRVQAHQVTANFFDLLGVDTTLGRTFRPDDAADAAAIISHSLWQENFGADPAIVGQTIRIDDVPHVVVGVTARGFSYTGLNTGRTPDLWMSRALPPNARADLRQMTLFPVARLRPGITLEQAQAEMDALGKAFLAELDDGSLPEGFTFWLVNAHDDLVESVRPSLWVMMGAAGLVLLIACVNVANLLVAQATVRRREMSLRAAVGAGRWRLARQLLTESLMLAVLGGAAGLLLARWGLAAVLAFAPQASIGSLGLGNSIPLLGRVGIDLRVVAVTLSACAVTAIACGLVPALRAIRSGPGASLGQRATAKEPRSRARQLLVAFEISLALVLMIGAGLLATTFLHLYEIPLGFDTDNVEAMVLELSPSRYSVLTSGDDGTQQARYGLRPERSELVRTLVSRLETVASVDSVGAVSRLPFQPFSGAQGANLHIEGHALSRLEADGIHVTLDASGSRDFSYAKTVTPDYFRTLQVPLLEGRGFRWSDDASAAPVAIVSRSMADAYWGGRSPVGEGLLARFGMEWRSLEIIGVVGDALQAYPSRPSDEAIAGEAISSWRVNRCCIYFPDQQHGAFFDRFTRPYGLRLSVVVRHHSDGLGVADAMQQVLRELDPDQPVGSIGDMETVVAGDLGVRRFYALLIGCFSAVAIVLALIGIYGVMAFQVSQRLHEIGVRMALGARTAVVVRMVVGEGFRVALLGALTGVLGAMAATRLLSGWLYGVSATDPLVFSTLSIVMVCVAVLACWWPARRAARVDPVASLRAE